MSHFNFNVRVSLYQLLNVVLQRIAKCGYSFSNKYGTREENNKKAALRGGRKIFT
jgi:hypothetical protein